MDMDTSIALLQNVLKEIYNLSERLLDVLGRKRRALVRLDLPELQRLMAEEESLVTALVDLESERGQISRRAATALGLQGEPSLMRIAEAAGEPVRGQLSELRGKLRDVAGRVSRLVDLVGNLAAKSVSFFGDMVRMIAGTGMVRTTYTAAGVVSAPRTRTWVDQKA